MKPAIIEEAERFRDELADVLNFQDWRTRGRSGEAPTRRQILSAFMYEAYNGKISVSKIAHLCGYRSKQRHTMIFYGVNKVKSLLSINDKKTVPLYRQARKVFREFEFKAEPEKKREFLTKSVYISPKQMKWIEGRTIETGLNFSEYIRKLIDSDIN